MEISGRFGPLNDRLQFNVRCSVETKWDTARNRTGRKEGYTDVTLAEKDDKPDM